jgi:hypothetical protein
MAKIATGIVKNIIIRAAIIVAINPIAHKILLVVNQNFLNI